MSESSAASENGKELRSLALTPTWSVATVLTVFVAVSLLVERSIHRLGIVSDILFLSWKFCLCLIQPSYTSFRFSLLYFRWRNEEVVPSLGYAVRFQKWMIRINRAYDFSPLRLLFWLIIEVLLVITTGLFCLGTQFFFIVVGSILQFSHIAALDNFK